MDWARASGPPLLTGRFRQKAEDFCVTELLEIDFTGDGEHDWLLVEKIGANTQWVADQLARHAGVKSHDVGYAGLKDRHAVARQWFSIRRPGRDGTDWNLLACEELRLIDQQRHTRKLKRGAHRGNAFRIAVHSENNAGIGQAVIERLQWISDNGVPNYFGEQRFGIGGSNIRLGEAVVAGRRMSRHKRSLGMSAIRSLEFNRELDGRVRAANWNRLLAGDIANLDGSASIFTVDHLTAELEQRCAELDIHPTGNLPGLESVGVKESRRALRMRVKNLGWDIQAGTLWLEFELGKGCYATSVLRELGRLM